MLPEQFLDFILELKQKDKKGEKMPIFELNLNSFDFPTGLENGKANFRFIADIRHVNEDGELATAHSVMPNFDTYWECDATKSGRPNYVRNNAHGFSMTLIDAWDRLILLTKAANIHSVQIKIFDVDRKDFWDKFKEIVAPIVESLFGIAKKATTGAIPKPVSFLTGAFGTAIEDIESYTLKKLANGEDRLLCKGTFANLPTAAGNHNIAPLTFNGSDGQYSLGLTLRIT